jgi:nucleotide-binding universal stress UspA family protein
MLVRLQGALGRDDLIDRMILIPQMSSQRASDQAMNLVVGYDSSPRSQIALDLTLWIAYQTRVATTREVTVQVVYVVDRSRQSVAPSEPALPSQPVIPAAIASIDVASEPLDFLPGAESMTHLIDVRDLFDVRDERSKLADVKVGLATANSGHRSDRTTTAVASPAVSPVLQTLDEFEQADRILWQARCLADEWRGSLKTHLRFGDLATELRKVVQEEAATLLVVGCESSDAPLVKILGRDFPCPVLGIPPELN